MWRALEFTQTPGFVERYTAGADGPGIKIWEQQHHQDLLPCCHCPRESAGLQPSTHYQQKSREEEQAQHDQPSEEMWRKGLRAVKRATTTRNLCFARPTFLLIVNLASWWWLATAWEVTRVTAWTLEFCKYSEVALSKYLPLFCTQIQPSKVRAAENFTAAMMCL